MIRKSILVQQYSVDCENSFVRLATDLVIETIISTYTTCQKNLSFHFNGYKAVVSPEH